MVIAVAWASPELRCDASKVEALSAKVATASDKVRAVGEGWAGLCEGDAVLDGQLGQLAGARPEDRWLVELQTVTIDPHAWWVACGTAAWGDASAALTMATKLDPARRRAHLAAACDLGRFRAFDEAEWSAGAGMSLLPLLAASALQQGGVSPASSRALVRALAGW